MERENWGFFFPFTCTCNCLLWHYHLVLIILPKSKLQSLELLSFFQWGTKKGCFCFSQDSPQDLWEKLKSEMCLVSWRTILKMIILFAKETLLLDPGLHCIGGYLKLPCDFQKKMPLKQANKIYIPLSMSTWWKGYKLLYFLWNLLSHLKVGWCILF